MSTLASRAERALLGAMLCDPLLKPELRYVEPGDFELNRHRMLYTAIRKAFETGNGTLTWRQGVASHAGDDVSADYLDELRAACPDPRHGRSYAALVLEAHFQRAMTEVAGDAGALAETISYDAARLTQSKSPGALAAVGLAGHVDQVALAISRHASRFSPSGTHAPVGPASPAVDDQGRNEELLLGALAGGHPDTRRLLTILGPAAFADPLRREVFTAVRAADAAGHAIDPLTVDWELARQRAWRGDNGQPAADNEPSYVTRLAEAAPEGEILPAARALAQRHTPRAVTSSPVQANGSSPSQSPRTMTPRQALANGSRLLQPPPGIPGNGQAPGPRR